MRKFLTQRIFHRIYFQSFLQNAKLIAFIYGIFSGFERGLLYAAVGWKNAQSVRTFLLLLRTLPFS